MTRSRIAKSLLIAFVAGAVFTYSRFDLGRLVSLDQLKANQALMQIYLEAHPLEVTTVYFFAYVLMAALSLPGAAIMTLAGGVLFGVARGAVIVSFASTIGATLAFLASRYLFRDLIRTRFLELMKRVDTGMEREGALYLLSLRLIPVFPFFAVNLMMGLTHIRIPTYFLVSQLGMLPATVIYVNAGTQLAKVTSLGGILNAKLILSFALLGVFPLLAKRTLEWIRRKRGTP
jgi:uncharacterized membrane protein YdjX (TVP38/TMEM64 family)